MDVYDLIDRRVRAWGLDDLVGRIRAVVRRYQPDEARLVLGHLADVMAGSPDQERTEEDARRVRDAVVRALEKMRAMGAWKALVC